VKFRLEGTANRTRIEAAKEESVASGIGLTERAIKILNLASAVNGHECQLAK
jgi:hypothetical protein